MPEGLTAWAGASGTSAILSVIAALPNLGWYLVLPRNGARNPRPQVAKAKPPFAEQARVSGRKNRCPRCSDDRHARRGGARRDRAVPHAGDAARANRPARARATGSPPGAAARHSW